MPVIPSMWKTWVEGSQAEGLSSNQVREREREGERDREREKLYKKSQGTNKKWRHFF
jgi:hypothetical protein